ncbi:MAG TPA: aspartate--tRNA(Asn) ligase [Thermomicrobiales bacterium]|nr:aspartate--tRNA(Asn) ligase [Thermomicrobiales bacterium]
MTRASSTSGTASRSPRVWTRDLASRAGNPASISGWIHHRRSLKSVCFLIIRDGTGTSQVVVEDKELRDRVEQLPHETVIRIDGDAVANRQAPDGVELRACGMDVLSQPVQEPPIELFRPQVSAQLPTQLDAAAVALRHPVRASVQRIAAAAVSGFRSTLTAQDFIEISTPKIIGTTPEGGANVFELDYFGRTAYLAQSPQLYKQIMVGVFERVFETAPAFRAEPHDTARHLSQFLSLDAEIGFIDNHVTVMEMVRTAVAGMVDAVGRLDLERSLPGFTCPAVPATIPHIHIADALGLISVATNEDVRNEPDLAPAHERWLGEWAVQEHGSDWLFVTGYPMSKRPFYTHPDPSNPMWSNSFDLLFRGMEIVTGGQRLHQYEAYLDALAARGIDMTGFSGYLDAFRYGMPPHGGFALGLERFVARIAGIGNVRETTLFPRDMQRLMP